MSRLLGATLLTSAGATSSSIVSYFCVNSCHDGATRHSYCVNNSTEYQGCETPPAGCNLMAFQTLYNEGTCEAFKASDPLCFGEGHGADSGRCPDAAVFQLVMDRNRDLDRTYMANDFTGVAKNLYRNGSVFVDSAFEPDIVNLYKNWSSSQVSLKRVPRNVLGRNAGPNSSTWVLHEVGSWEDSWFSTARYTRWSYSGNPFGWQIETDVDLRATTENKKKPSNYTDAIRERYAVYNAMYEAGNFSGLVADLYTSDAVLALTSGSFVEHDSLELSLSSWSNFQVSLAVGEEGANVVHDVGMVDGSYHPWHKDSHRYYARWEKCGEEWKIAVHAHSGPHSPRSEAYKDDEDQEEGKPGVLVA